MLENELETAIALANSASELILEHYATEFETEQKLGVDDEYEPVTVADREASRVIVSGLETQFPTDAVLSEEEADDTEKRLAAKRAWIIDPIDGTAGFVKRDGDFAVQIGLAIEGRAVLGIVLLPFYGRLYYATLGAGAFVLDSGEEPVRLAVSEVTERSQMSAAVSRHHPSTRIARISEHFAFRRLVNRGSVGLKVGLIADRTCDIYIHPSPRTKLWDTCAPQIILEEAGGGFTDLFGGEYRYDRRDLRNLNGILATNGVSHHAAVAHLRPLLNEFGRLPVDLNAR